MTREEFIENWLDNYMDKHADEKIENFDALREQADCAWYDEQVEHGEKTEYDLTDEQKKVAQEACRGKAVDAYGKTHKRERKENPDKRFLLERLQDGLIDGIADLNVTITNPERQLDFEFGGIKYSVTLTAHRKPKG